MAEDSAGILQGCYVEGLQDRHGLHKGCIRVIKRSTEVL